MDSLFLSRSQLEILYKNKRQLESRYKVKVLMPEVENSDLCADGEVFHIMLSGDSQNIEFVKRFLNRKVDAMKTQENNQSVIVLNSDSESDSEIVLTENNTKSPKRKKQRIDAPVIDLVSSSVSVNESIILCDEVSSTTNEVNDSIIILDAPPAEDFIPLTSRNTNEASCSRTIENNVLVVELSSTEEDSSDEEDAPVVNDSETIPKPVSSDPKLLRPVVIDGSNVARSHGKPHNTYSCKGIKICVEYFLKRGHTSVTAFVPHFRKHCKHGRILTTDQDILEELEKTQNVVFTPSRRLEGKAFSCYDDRFIVELAVNNGGVILSNDNFKDLIDTSPAFKETIQKRLLMYCFVGDLLMIPNDPLGCRGPTLDEFLSFPPTSES